MSEPVKSTANETAQPWRAFVRSVRQLLLLTLVSGLSVGAAGASILIRPDPLFAHRIEQGRLTLLSDRPLEELSCRRVLAEVDAQLGRSPLDTGEGTHKIVVANTDWRRRLVFLWAYGGGGVNFYPLTRNVFLSGSAEDCSSLISPEGAAVPSPRTLAYFATHEIGHSLTGEAIGPIAYTRLPVWIREGLADYIAFSDRSDFEALVQGYLENDPALQPKLSGLYTRYRLLVLHFLEVRGWSEAELLSSNLTQSEAEHQMLQYLEARAVP